MNSTVKPCPNYERGCRCDDCMAVFEKKWREERLEELLEVPIEERRSWYGPYVCAIVDTIIADGGIKTNEDYDRFYDMVMAIPKPKPNYPQPTDEEIEEDLRDIPDDVREEYEELEKMYGPGPWPPLFNHQLRQAEILYAAMTGMDEMDLPLPKHEREERARQERRWRKRQTGDITVYGEPGEYEPEYVYGLFRRGAAHILHGPSGTGKTTFLLEFEDAGRNGREFLGYKGEALDPLFILRDRPISDYYETLDGLGLPRNFVRMVELPFADSWDAVAAQRISDLIEQHDRPTLVVVEGLDHTIKKTISREQVIPQVQRMRALAEHYGCALVGTWGAPKRQSNPKDAYMNSRDAAAGVSDLGRLVGMMVGLGFEYEPYRKGQTHRGKTGNVHVAIEPRAGEPRYTRIKRESGRMVEAPAIRVNIAPMDGLGYKETVDALRAQLAALEGVSKATFYREKKKARETGVK